MKRLTWPRKANAPHTLSCRSLARTAAGPPFRLRRPFSSQNTVVGSEDSEWTAPRAKPSADRQEPHDDRGSRGGGGGGDTGSHGGRADRNWEPVRHNRTSLPYQAPMSWQSFGNSRRKGAPTTPTAPEQLANPLRDVFAPDSTSSLDYQSGPFEAVDTDTPRQLDVMLVASGLSNNLDASDFYRLVPNDLSSWQNVIRKVQQHRDPMTLEPYGRYHIAFGSRAAATAYRDRLQRLHKISHHAATSEDTLWESTLPNELKPANGDGTDATRRELEMMTLQPGTQKINVKHRTNIEHAWADRLSAAVEPMGYGPHPSVVLLAASPPNISAFDLFTFIKQDGRDRLCGWKVSRPLALATSRAWMVDDFEPADGDADDRSTWNSRVDEDRLQNEWPAIHQGDTNTGLERDGTGGKAGEGKGEEPVEEDEDEDDEEADDYYEEAAQEDNHINNNVLWRSWSEARVSAKRLRLRGRFLVVCADEAEAWRFQRNWNQKTLTQGSGPAAEMYKVSVSVIQW